MTRPGVFPADVHTSSMVKVVRRRSKTGLGYGEKGTKTFRSVDDARWFIEQGRRAGMDVRVYTAQVVWERADG